jgi:hypothetical protein
MKRPLGQLQNKIQEENAFVDAASTSGDMDRNRQHVDSDGNRVNVGNFDANGLKVNNNWDDNRNDNLGLASSARNFNHLD